jgi:uracil-DNA glycosylase
MIILLCKVKSISDFNFSFITICIKMEYIHSSWKPLFDQYEFDLDQIQSENNESNLPVYPPKQQIFRVFEKPVDNIRVLLLGQDPYHGPGQAHGLSFSVEQHVRIPPSLQNIFKELQSEFPDRKYSFKTGDLTRWFNEEDIFLLNASLSVIKGKPSSHMNLWEEFTNDVIEFVQERNKKCVFLLLGNFAKGKAQVIKDKTRIITGVHPSPYSASNGFFGSDLFKKVENALGEPINWQN